MARRIPPSSPRTSVTEALSIATSVPVPMAMPTSASARAGASLTPSPAVAAKRVGTPDERRRVEAFVFQESAVTDRDATSGDDADHAFARKRSELARLDEIDPSPAGAGDERRGERMLARALEARDRAQELALVDPRQRFAFPQRRLSPRGGSRLFDPRRIEPLPGAQFLGRAQKETQA